MANKAQHRRPPHETAARWWSIEEIRAPLLVFGLCVVILNAVFGRRVAEFLSDPWEAPALQSAAYFTLAAVSTVAHLCILFAILSSVMLKLCAGHWPNQRIAAVSLAASLAIMIGGGLLLGVYLRAAQQSRLDREARIQAEFAEIAKSRDLRAQCWDDGRRVETFELWPFYGQNGAGDAEYPSEAAALLQTLDHSLGPVFYEAGVVATGFAVHLCFASLADDKAMLFTVSRHPPASLSVSWNTSRVSFEKEVRNEAKRFLEHVRAGRDPARFEPEAERVLFETAPR